MPWRLKTAEYFRNTNALDLYYQELGKTQFWAHDRLQDLQWQRLKTILKHAYDNVPYYKRTFNAYGLPPDRIQSYSDLKKLPTLTKEIIRENYNDLLAVNHKQYKSRLLSSGGSTGVPLRFYVDKFTNSYAWADVYRGQILAGWRPDDKMAKVWGSSILSIKSKVSKNIYRWLNNWYFLPAFNSEPAEMLRWIELIRKEKILTISGYVDTIVDFGRFVIEKGLQTQLVAAFPTTAPLTQAGRQIIENAFGCGVFDLYQSADGGLSSFECHQHQGLHVAVERCYVEFPEGPGEHDITVVVTDLFNYAMPFIRYENGDEVAVTNDLCACGRALPLIKRVRGKTYHQLVLANGERIHSEIFSYHLNNFQIVKHYCVTQTSPVNLIMEIAVDPRYNSELPAMRESIANLERTLSGFTLEVKLVDQINKAANLKYVNFVPFKEN